jgi:hypothetical protein
MKKILRSFFSIATLILITSGLMAQSERIKGLRLGVDLSRFALYYLAPEREGYEVSGDFEIKKDIYIAGEYGKENVTLEKESFDYKSDGYYFRAGVDRNFLNYDSIARYEMAYAGLRYGFSSQTHSANNIIVKSPYWGDLTNAGIPEIQCNTHWVEVVAGIRAELFKGFFIGWSVRGRVRLAHSGYGSMEPYNVPGYGNGSKKSNLGFNFSIYYRIPLFKQTVNYKKQEIR